jgi:hypothetical protein
MLMVLLSAEGLCACVRLSWNGWFSRQPSTHEARIRCDVTIYCRNSIFRVTFGRLPRLSQFAPGALFAGFSPALRCTRVRKPARCPLDLGKWLERKKVLYGNDRIKPCIKLMMLKQEVVETLLHGCAAWATKAEDIAELIRSTIDCWCRRWDCGGRRHRPLCLGRIAAF